METAGTRSPSHVLGPANILLGSRGQEHSGHQAADSSDLFLISPLVAQIMWRVFLRRGGPEDTAPQHGPAQREFDNIMTLVR